MMFRGEVPAEVLPTVYGANYIALGKSDGGTRAIAAGTTLRRLAAKVICKRFVRQMVQKLRPVQLGFGTKSGCEVIHCARNSYANRGLGVKVLSEFDHKNAFNMVLRRKCYNALLMSHRHTSNSFSNAIVRRRSCILGNNVFF